MRRAASGGAPPLRRWYAGAFAVVVVLAVLGGFGSGLPDGLEWVAGQLGFASAASDGATAGSPLAGYEVSGLPSVVGAGLAGLLGSLVVLGAAWGLVALVRPRRG